MKRFSPKQTALLILGVLILGIGITAGFFSWRSYVIASQEKRGIEAVQRLLAQSRPEEALAIIRALKGQDKSGKWLSFEIQALEQSRNIHRLLYLYSQHPMEILKQEKASLLVARALLENKKMEVYNQLRNAWHPREKSPELWFALDVDALLIQGKKDEARTLLASRSFKGASDCGRLIRLAMLKSGENLDEAWLILDKAYRADPRNPDVRSFRAQILESEGKIPSARVEYVAAHLSDPRNPLLCDQLAEFYRRQCNYSMALQTWTDSLTSPTFDFIWVKALFWAKVAHPVSIDLKKAAPPAGEMTPLIKVMQSMKPQMFWDDRPVQEDVNLQKISGVRQEVYWLKLLQALKDGSETRAMDLLKSSPYKYSSFNTELERALKIILIYRKWGILVEPDDQASRVSAARKLKHQFFEQLDALTLKKKDGGAQTQEIPQGLDNLLKSKEVFCAAFLAGGWLEAAIILHSLPVIPDNYPDWLSYGLTQALRYNRGNKEALSFASHQRPTPALDMLTSEILLADNHADRAISKLQSLAQCDTDIGFRAAWLLSLAELNKGDLNESKRIVNEHKSLSSSAAGKEILAKIALNQGNTQEADKIYSQLAEQSLEAKAYLARRAFQNKDWNAARKYTEELLNYFPDMLELRENIMKIAWEEKHGRP